jgi:hypothetical protein
MSSVTSAFAQVDRRVGYFICVSGCTVYTDVSANSDNNSWNVNSGSSQTITVGTIFEDMGEIAKYQGAILRKVRPVAQVAGGAAVLTTYWIVVPGGEYPVAGVPGPSGLTVGAVARLG